ERRFPARRFGGACGEVISGESFVVTNKVRKNMMNMSMNMMNTLNMYEHVEFLPGMKICQISAVVMSESSDRESLDPPAFGGDDTESEEPSQYICSEEESSDTEGLVEGTIESRMIVPGVRGLSHPKILRINRARGHSEPGSSLASKSRGGFEQPGITIRVCGYSRGFGFRGLDSGRCSVAEAEYAYRSKLAQLRKDFSDIPWMVRDDFHRYVSARLQTPFHPWVQMMLAKLGYAPGQYNPNFWILLHGVYIAWWLAGLGEPALSSSCTSTPFPSNREILAGYRQLPKGEGEGLFIGHKPTTQKSWRNRFSEVGPISKEKEDEVEWVRAQLSDTERECGNLVTQKNLFESGLLQGSRDAKAAEGVSAKKAEKSAGKRPRDDDEGRVADVLGKRRALEEAHQQVMGSGPRLPPFDLQAPPKLPFGMEDVFAEGVEKVDFSRLRQQKKEVNLAMHRRRCPW
ncbi:hypothetical protein Prudu_1468S000100, partial [Prunus dulcis]